MDMINFIPMIILLLGVMILIGLGERHHQKKQRINSNKQNIKKKFVKAWNFQSFFVSLQTVRNNPH